MTWDVALILGIDGLANGAVYLLAGLGLVLIFSVTRVVFVPFGDVAAFSALSLAAFEAGAPAADRGPGRHAGAACRDRRGVAPRAARRDGRIPRAVLGWGVLPLLPCRSRGRARGSRAARGVHRGSPSLLVVPITPLVARLALQPIADASVLVLLIASLALHFLLSGLGLLFFGPEGFRTAPLVGGAITLPRRLPGERPGDPDAGRRGRAQRAVLSRV